MTPVLHSALRLGMHSVPSAFYEINWDCKLYASLGGMSGTHLAEAAFDTSDDMVFDTTRIA